MNIPLSNPICGIIGFTYQNNQWKAVKESKNTTELSYIQSFNIDNYFQNSENFEIKVDFIFCKFRTKNGNEAHYGFIRKIKSEGKGVVALICVNKEMPTYFDTEVRFADTFLITKP